MSAVNLDGGVSEQFEDSETEVECDVLKLGPCLFQDDIARLATDLESVKDGNKKIEDMAEKKLLDFNLDKTCMVIIGTKKFQKGIMEKVKANPIIFCNKVMKVSSCDKYLGDYVSSNLPDSVFRTIQKRKGLSKRLISEIKVTVEDIRSNCVGGIVAGLDIWNMAVVPFLFNNCDTWMEIPKKAINILNSIQNSFFVSLFGTAKSCPIPIFYRETGVLSVENFIILKKLFLFHYILSLEDNVLAKEVMSIQLEKELPGLATKCLSFMRELDVHEDPLTFSKCQWNKKINQKIHERNRTQLLDRIKLYSKLEYSKFSEEEYGMKDYLRNMKIEDARTFFASRGRMLRTVQMNYKNKPEYAANSYKCICGEDDHQVHLTSCPSYKHLREGLNLEGSDTDLVRYYQLIIKEREKKGDN